METGTGNNRIAKTIAKKMLIFCLAFAIGMPGFILVHEGAHAANGVKNATITINDGGGGYYSGGYSSGYGYGGSTTTQYKVKLEIRSQNAPSLPTSDYDGTYNADCDDKLASQAISSVTITNGKINGNNGIVITGGSKLKIYEIPEDTVIICTELQVEDGYGGWVSTSIDDVDIQYDTQNGYYYKYTPTIRGAYISLQLMKNGQPYDYTGKIGGIDFKNGKTYSDDYYTLKYDGYELVEMGGTRGFWMPEEGVTLEEIHRVHCFDGGSQAIELAFYEHITGQKELRDSSGNPLSVADGQFDFDVQIDKKPGNWAPDITGGTPDPASGQVVPAASNRTASVKAGGEIDFGWWCASSDSVRSEDFEYNYIFTFSEKPDPSVQNIQYDAKTVKAEVKFKGTKFDYSTWDPSTVIFDSATYTDVDTQNNETPATGIKFKNVATSSPPSDTGSLKIKKETENSPSVAEFTFHLKLGGLDPNNYYGNGTFFKGLSAQGHSDCYEFKLSGNQDITLDNIPKGTAYEVYEVDGEGSHKSVNESPKSGWTLTEITSGSGTVGNSTTQVTFKNTYRPAPVKLTVTKAVTGNMGDRTREFSFEVMINGGSGHPGGSTETFTLEHGESKNIDDIEAGSSVEVTETNYSGEGYSTHVTVGNIRKDNERSITIDDIDSNTTVSFENAMDGTVPTELRLRSIWVGIIMFVLAVLAIAVRARFKRKADSVE